MQHNAVHAVCRGVTVTLACPGPVATGTEGMPRNVFSAEGLTAKHEERGGAKKRLAPKRVAELIARAAYNGLDTAWIARHPVLLLGACCSFPHIPASTTAMCYCLFAS